MFSIQTKKIKSNEVFYFSHDLANFSLGIAIFFKTGREKGQVLHSYNILRFFGDTDLNQGGKVFGECDQNNKDGNATYLHQK
ncbi:MAG: hypothetical protein ACYCZ2_15145 [Lutibacter sp.]